MQSVAAESATHLAIDDQVRAGEPCPPSGVWPPGCMPGGGGGGAGEPCPPSGVWPPGCNPNGGGGSAPAPGAPCPPSGVWPPGCNPNGGGGGAPAPAPAPGAPCPASGPWPPGCTPSGSPAPTPGDDTPPPDSPAAEEPIGVITLVYNSDPDEVLGVFPVYEFNAETLVLRMIFNELALIEMRANLDGALSGDQAACDNYEQAYEIMKASGGFYVDVPSEWRGIYSTYVNSFIVGLDRTRPAYLACLNDGQVNQFNYGLAFTAINDALNQLTPAIDQALVLLP